MKKTFLFIIILLAVGHIAAQSRLNTYVETGKNAVSMGQYADLGAGFSTDIDRWSVGALAALHFTHTGDYLFKGIKLDVSHDLTIQKKLIELGAFYQWRPFSELVSEWNVGLLASRQTRKFFYQFGVNTRVYQLGGDYEGPSSRVWEIINLMYRVQFEHSISELWKMRVAVTNFDHLIIQQETNPLLIAGVEYALQPDTDIYMDLGYLQAGLMNIRVNYFGYFVRGGLRWNL